MNLRGVSTKLNKYIVFTMQTYKKLNSILVFTGHSSVVGLVIAPLMLLGGPLVVRAAACTAGVVASLSLTAACAPSDKFLSWGGPLALGLGGIFVASIGKQFCHCKHIYTE